MEYKIEIYQTDSGKRPFSLWLKDIKDHLTKAKVRLRLDRLEMGNFGQCEPVGEGVFELKIDFGPGYRVYFGKIGSKCVLLLCAGDKGSQKSDIQKAKVYFKDYQSRGDADE
ncbi:MAG TPA: type II toxin-antitoxin system RelE/ParE family toxin [Waddliaceae bacterium]